MAEARKLDDAYALKFILSCRNESRMARTNRMELNRANYDMYQMRYDFSHKQDGQSMEVLSKTRNAVEQIKSFFQQSLADLGDWFRITKRSGGESEAMLIRPEEMQKLMNYFLVRAGYFSHVGNSIQSGLLGSLAVSKIHGIMVAKPKYKVQTKGKGKAYQKNVVMVKDKTWELRFEDVRQENYFPDPTDAGLYKIFEGEIDLHELKKLAEGPDAMFDMEKVNQISAGPAPTDQTDKRARETGQNPVSGGARPRVKITEFWGSIIDESTGDIMAENIVCTIANDHIVIRSPTENPLWHQGTPIVAAPLIEVSHSPWGIALMDSGTKLNHALIELWNLMLDSAMYAIHGIRQLRTDALVQPEQANSGIKPGTVLLVNSSLQPGQKAMETVVTGEIPQDAITMYNLLSQETNTQMMTNDLRMGAQSMRAVKATEVAAAENSLSSIFQGMAKNYESKKIQPELELACWEICQNWDLIDKEVFLSLFGNERGGQLAALDPQDVFANTVNGMKFEVFGISLTLRRQADFRKYTTLMQTIAASQPLIEAFLQKYSFEKFLGEVMTALDIDKSKIENEQEGSTAGGPSQPSGPGPNGPPSTLNQPGAAPGASPNQMSQVPSAANVPQGGGLAAMLGGMQMNAKGSNAVG